MTISTDPSSPLVVVVGATGIQGGSVVRNLVESDKPYRLRGLTRDASKPASLALKQLGIEVVSVTVAVGNDAAVREAFKGADVVFAVTNFWEHTDPARETAEGKLMVDAAKAAGAKLFIWSGLPDVTKSSGGKYTHVYHFDSKAAVTPYAFSQLPTVDVQAGFYMTNMESKKIGVRRRADGSLVWEHPLAATELPEPYMDIVHDYGLFVRYAIESPEYSAGGKTIHTYGELITHIQAAEIFSRVRGTNVDVKPLSVEEYLANAKAQGIPPHVLDDMRDLAFMGEQGYYFGQESTPEQQKIREGLPRRPRTFEEFLKATPDFLKAKA